jgi:hypothetical protein
MTHKKEDEEAWSGPPQTRKQRYDNKPRTEPGRVARHTSSDDAVRVILPDEPPRLTPGAARALLRILIKAHDRLADSNDAPQGAAE